ncbi:MAG: polysaccharide biosynthesis/export family protein [Pirellulales bacterium]|nr:polysaccharide biosynthesis/export family protein [Pirellulales bacterium]
MRILPLLLTPCMLMCMAHLHASADEQGDGADQLAGSYEQWIATASKLSQKLARLDEDAPDQESLRASVNESLSKAFDLRQQIQRREVAAARAELDAIEKRIEEREKFKAAIIRRKAAELLLGNELGWPAKRIEPNRLVPQPERIQAGDVVAVYLDGVLPYYSSDNTSTPPPITKLDSGFVVTGYPFVVASDGTIQLPLVDPVKIEGMSIREAEKMVAKAYIDNGILHPARTRPIITLVPRAKTVLPGSTLPAIQAN